MAGLTAFILAAASLVALSHAQYGNTCPGPVPANIRVWAVPDSLYVAPSSGFLVQLLDALKGITNIPYTLSPHPELSFGNQNPNGTFDGSLIGALVNNQADLVGTDLTVTWARENVADFLMPFSQYQLQVVANKATGITSATNYLCQDDADLQLLKNSKNATLNAIYNNINSNRPASIVAPNDDAGAIAKVASGNWAYVGESPQITRALASSANAGAVMVVPGSLGNFYLALAVQQGSGLREVLNLAMLQLAESGVLTTLLNANSL